MGAETHEQATLIMSEDGGEKPSRGIGHSAHTNIRCNVSSGNLAIVKERNEKMFHRTASKFSQEYKWYWRGIFRAGAACRHGLLGAAAAGVGYYILHQHIWRGAGCNIEALSSVSVALGRPPLSSVKLAGRDGAADEFKRNWNHTVDLALKAVHWQVMRAPETAEEVATQVQEGVQEGAQLVYD